MTDLKDLARRVSELEGPSREVDAETRFWAKVTRGRATDCWLWNGAKHGTRQQFRELEAESGGSPSPPQP